MTFLVLVVNCVYNSGMIKEHFFYLQTHINLFGWLFNKNFLQIIVNFLAIAGGVWAGIDTLRIFIDSRTKIKVFLSRSTVGTMYDNLQIIWCRLDFVNKSSRPLTILNIKAFENKGDAKTAKKNDYFNSNVITDRQFVTQEKWQTHIGVDSYFTRNIETTQFPIDVQKKASQTVLVEILKLKEFHWLLLETSRGRKIIKVCKKYTKQVPIEQIR